MRCVPLLIALVALSAPAWGAQDERTQVDEFAVGSERAGSGIEQIDPQGRPLGPSQAVTDRQVAVPQTPASQRGPIGQLSERDPDARPDQLGGEQEPAVEVVSVSTKSDSRPRSAAPLGGSDRCDPQLDREELVQCRRILERRAAEFDAPGPPVLSAEQRLLAEQDRDEGSSAESRLRLASQGRPDADLISNQELASLYLESPPPPSSRPQPAPEETEGLAEILQGLIVQTQGAGAGPGP